jgi:YHS domain-containing protein
LAREIDMEALLYFAFWAGLIFLMMRFGCGSHVMGHGEGHENHAAGENRPEAESGDLRWQPPEKVKDLICGKMIKTATAKSSVLNGFVYYFCSNECREQFETRMAALGKASGAKQPDQLEHSHA